MTGLVPWSTGNDRSLTSISRETSRIDRLQAENDVLREKLKALQEDFLGDRVIERFSAKGELVFDPFGGIGTVPVRALRLGRRGAGVELNGEYWRDAVRHLEATERELATPTLFEALQALTLVAAE